MNISPNKLIELRKERGWSQEKLAAISGVSERTIQRAERDGSCSLDTKMALATAFELAPSALSAAVGAEPSVAVRFKTSWSGAAGLFVLGLLAPLVVLLTATDGKWEIASCATVLGLCYLLTMMNYGAKAAYRLFDRTSWLVRYPTHVPGLSALIVQAQAVIHYAYGVGLVASLVAALAIAVHAPAMLDREAQYIAVIVRPLVYAILFVELWFRPYKKRMEAMLTEQSAKFNELMPKEV